LLKKFIRVVSGKGMEELGNYGDIDKIKNTLLCSRVFYLKSWADYSPLKGRRAVILARLIALARILW
jgi:hypothetical protein